MQTKSAKRLLRLVARCLRFEEPVLLVGETGTGKTTVCQAFAAALGRKLHIVNCHQNTETSDLVGGFRPVRGKEQAVARFRCLLRQYFARVRAVAAGVGAGAGGAGGDSRTDACAERRAEAGGEGDGMEVDAEGGGGDRVSGEEGGMCVCLPGAYYSEEPYVT